MASDRFGQIDVLVNDAGVDHLRLVNEDAPSAFASVIETDLYGVVQMTRTVVDGSQSASDGQPPPG